MKLFCNQHAQAHSKRVRETNSLTLRNPVKWVIAFVLTIYLGGIERHVPCVNTFHYQNTPDEVTSVTESHYSSGGHRLESEADPGAFGGHLFLACRQLALHCALLRLFSAHNQRQRDMSTTVV